MKKNAARIIGISPGSLAEEAGICPGDRLLSVNGFEVHDILEYRYLMSEYEVTVTIEKQDGSLEEITIENDYEDIGIEFESGLIDDAKSCTNKCIFCFIDQLPKGMRETVYFKDDDTRLSFLQGNYVTLTNMKDDELDRMIKMHVSPINISVHTTNPQLRAKMLNNRFAGRVYDIMRRFYDNGIHMNCQAVLCPGINDGAEFERTIKDVRKLYPYADSLAAVPVGLTAHREGLFKLREFTREECAEVIDLTEKYQRRYLEEIGTRLVYLSDEFYINAGRKIPAAEEYEGFPQMENGVGLVASMEEEFLAALSCIEKKTRRRHVSVVTGELAYPFIRGLTEKLSDAAEGFSADVYAVKNDFFGGGVNVAGLVCGNDIIKQLRGKIRTEELFIPEVMLRDGEEVFLDDVTLPDVEDALGVRITAVANDGYDFAEKLLGEEI